MGEEEKRRDRREEDMVSIYLTGGREGQGVYRASASTGTLPRRVSPSTRFGGEFSFPKDLAEPCTETHRNPVSSLRGFELYFPHPVLQRLNPSIQKEIAIIQQIATVLSFAISHLPSFIPIPPTTLLILKGLAPVIGYIASFMGWAWNGIESKDQGKGIILSATWLCPVALVPRSWDAPDAPKDSTTSQPPVTSTPTKPPTQPIAAPPTPPATPAHKTDPPKVAFPSSPSRAPDTPSSVGVNGEKLQQLDTGGGSPSRTPRRISLTSPLSPRTKARIFKWRKEKGDVAPDQPVL